MENIIINGCPEEIINLIERYGCARKTINIGDNVIHLSGHADRTGEVRYVSHGEVIDIVNGIATIKILEIYYLHGGTFRDTHEVNRPVEYLLTPFPIEELRQFYA